MSVSFRYEVINPTSARTFDAGVSSDAVVLEEVFGTLPVTMVQSHIPTLRAMHKATGQIKTLWSEIADVLERLQGEDYSTIRIEGIKIWAEY